MQARKSFVTWSHLCCLLCACMQGSCFRPRTSSVYFGNLGMPLLSSSSGGEQPVNVGPFVGSLRNCVGN
ncbi:hypothetical protein PF004_g5804 [Phytophthora fragariae]|uniref:Secreted protein n=1 Tax=Phytophthora fragariae TaxID=53985 RepID=A0A6A3JW28_9STRA|nr:hypothetical protein PF011_g14736 [Phytophthora fragariae]KAE9244154.1 hypothetical protein PF004_g5804 [Phytophthora fragariae]